MRGNSDPMGDFRAMSHHASDWNGSWTTPELCRDTCDSEGYSLAGLEMGRECWCGNSIYGDPAPVAAKKCNTPCSGDEDQNCGGPNYMSLYARRGYNFTIGFPSDTPPPGIVGVTCLK